MSQVSNDKPASGIEAKLANETELQKTEPLQVSQEVADNLSYYRPAQCPRAVIFQGKSRAYDGFANVANLQTLEERLRAARQCTRYLDARAEFNDKLATLLARNGSGSTSDIAQRYQKRTLMMVGMPAAYHTYRAACRKYDDALAATLKQESSSKVGKLVEQGLTDANRTVDTVQSTLSSAGEAPAPVESK